MAGAKAIAGSAAWLVPDYLVNASVQVYKFNLSNTGYAQ
jgi:hypothetical protein